MLTVAAFFKKLSMGLAAGLLISVGGCVFLACNGDNRYVGAFFFSVALLCICMKGYALYTGKICYVLDDHSADANATLLIGLLGNIIATLLCGLLIRYAIPNVGEMAETVCASKLAGQNFLQTVIRSVFCGVMVYLSVAIYKEKNTPVGIIFCIPTFILSGFEHSVADMFYFGAAGLKVFFSGEGLLFLLAVLIGNSLGGLLLPALQKVGTCAHKAQ